MAGKTTTKNKRKTTSNVDVRLTTKFTKAEKDMIIETAKKRKMKQREFILQSINEFEANTRKKEKKEANLVNLITSINNILSDVHTCEVIYGESEVTAELKMRIERSIKETWKCLSSF